MVAEYELKILRREYNIKKRPIVFDFKKAVTYLLSSTNNEFNRYFHYIHYYPGRIYPYIVLYILSLKDFIHLNGFLLDPFAGSGTILLESIINPVLKRNALGIEINPLGRLICKVKTTPIDPTIINQLIKEIRMLYTKKVNPSDCVPKSQNLNLWFSAKAIEKLAILKYAIKNLNTHIDYKDFFWLCFSSIIRKISKADPYIPPPVVLKLEKYKNSPKKYQKLRKHLDCTEDPDVWTLFENAVKTNITKLNYLNNIRELKNKLVTAKVIWDDARNIKNGQLVECGRINKNSIKELPSNSIDIIFTSPPYLTAQKYIRTSRLELLWLGYTEKEISNLDKISIGTERVSVDIRIRKLGIDSIDSLINHTSSEERKKLVYSYFENMIKVLKEIYRLLKRGGYAIFVVGDNKVSGKMVNTYRLLTDAAINEGFEELLILKDEIRVRSMMTKRNGTGGIIRDEYVIILKKEG